MNRDIFDEKDMLELLNYIDMDDKENYEDGSLKMDDLRKKRLKKNLLKNIKDKNSVRKFRYKVAAVAAVAVVFIGAAMPALAKNVPALNSIIQAFHDSRSGDHGEYEKYSKVVNKSVTDKGITLTINEVLCDESSLMIGYTIKSESDIKNIVKSGKDTIEAQGKNENFTPFTLIRSIKIDGKYADSGSWQDGKYLDDHTYINSDNMDIGNKNFPSVFNVDIDVKEIYGVKGNWIFKFSVSKDEILRNTKTFKPNTKIKFQDATINVEKVSFTPINTSIKINGKYNKEEYKNVDKRKKAFKQDIMMGNMLYDKWFVFDDKGNEITEKGSSSNEIKNSSYDFYYDLKFVSSKYIPKYLTVIPYRNIYRKDNDGKTIAPIYKNIDGIYPIELSQGKMGKLIIKEIKTEKDKTIVRYTAEGQAPFYQARWLFILDEKDKDLERKDNNFEVKKDKNSPNDYIMEFKPLDKNMKYRIGTNINDDIEIRNDLKFKIDLNK
ncbi:DUF4179 domain-containing protein [Clostridium sp. P21]|uniref:DUF4179 domain-containing protein n=1 Tax=Clostridium muellerianum TaxID=2716538 RepID=A0A7Y0EGT9_9CLOT|nr:DUF4179 domain-containing protein [Clostridium muellerianum]NMM62200.1 DUF4179 domain-containing protein [Clostridium muellerianum]